MPLSWNTIALPETKYLKDIISEELKRNSQQRQTKEHPDAPHRVKWKCSMGDEEFSKVLQGQCVGVVYKPSLLRDKSSEFEDTDEFNWEKFDLILREFDPIPLHNCKNQPDIHDKKYKNLIYGVDPQAKLILKEMVIEKVFDRIEELISKGKQATILHVSKNQLKHYIVKGFKTSEVCDIKSAELKAQNERNRLLRLRRAGIPCPKVILLRGHILVTSLIGQNKPAPNIADIHLVGTQARITYTLVLEYMKTLYNECNLVHGNLSEKKVLSYREYCPLIDLSWAAELFEDGALDLLFNDCVNICKFFTKLNILDFSPEELFQDITGCDFNNKIALVKLRDDLKTRTNLNIAT